EMASEDAVVVVVEGRLAAPFKQLGELLVAARAAEIAPAVDHVHLGRFALAVVLDDAKRSGVRPARAGQLRERRSKARVVQVPVLAAGADAGAASELVAEARAQPGFIEAERFEAQAMCIGELAQSGKRDPL